MIINIINSLYLKRRIKSYIKEVNLLNCTKKGNKNTKIRKNSFFRIKYIKKVFSKYAYKSRKS